jgi:molybdate transport repressor ModE-like protein
VLVELVDRGSMSAAAESLGLAQSTVSEAIAALERELGTRIVTRSRGASGGTLTAAGRALLPHARSALAALDAARNAVAGAAQEARARVEVIANESVSTYLLPRALAVLRAQWPKTRFSITIGTCDTVRAGVAAGRFDLGLLLEPEPPARTTRGVANGDTMPVLGPVLLTAFASPRNPLVRPPGRAVERAALARLPIFLSDASGDFFDLLRAYFTADGLPEPRLEIVGSIDAVKRSVLEHPLGVGVLPAYTLEAELTDGRLRALALRPAFAPLRLGVRFNPAQPAGPAARALLEALRPADKRPQPAPPKPGRIR